MTMDVSLSQDDVKALEQTRQRLAQLTSGLTSLQQHILQSDPLPPWPSFQSLASILSQHLASVSEHINNHQDLFSSMAVYPQPEFPGRTQENLLGQLLRKKLEPDVEDWVAEGLRTANDALGTGSSTGLKEQDMQDLWGWAGMAANEQARKHTWGGNYTIEEKAMGIENVVTGLRRKLKANPEDSSDDDENEESDEAMKDDSDDEGLDIVGVHRTDTGDGVEIDLRQHKIHETSTALPMNDIFRFMMTGKEPQG